LWIWAKKFVAFASPLGFGDLHAFLGEGQLHEARSLIRRISLELVAKFSCRLGILREHEQEAAAASAQEFPRR